MPLVSPVVVTVSVAPPGPFIVNVGSTDTVTLCAPSPTTEKSALPCVLDAADVTPPPTVSPPLPTVSITAVPEPAAGLINVPKRNVRFAVMLRARKTVTWAVPLALAQMAGRVCAKMANKTSATDALLRIAIDPIYTRSHIRRRSTISCRSR